MKKKKKYYQYDFQDVYGKRWEINPKRIHGQDGQINIEDYYDNSILGEESPEEFIHRKMSALPQCRIMRRTIISGDRVEIDIYPQFMNRRDVPRAKRTKESREEQKKLNNKNSKKRLVRIICANFHKGDLILTPTYEDGYYPTQEQSRRDMKNYIQRLRRYRRKQGLPPLKYIYVTEYVPEGEKTKKVRIHHHMIINAMDRDIAESLWKTGRIESKYAQPDDFELEGFAHYIAKLSAEKGHHKWVASKNMDKPKEYKSVTQLTRKRFAEIIKLGDKKAELIENLYPGQFKYLDSSTYISDEYGGFYLYSRLRRKVSVWKDVENVQSKENTLSGSDLQEKKIDCKAFLEFDWEGSLREGEAIYSIILEAINKKGIAVTREYFGRISHTTKNRALLMMAYRALSKLKPCSVEFHSTSKYLNIDRFQKQRESAYKDVKNAELIDMLLELGKDFDMAAVCEEKNEYTGAMKVQRELQYKKMRIVEDKRNGE